MYSGQEIDYIEEKDGELYCYEFKYNAGAKIKKPTTFIEQYEPKEYRVVNTDNWFEFVL
jgi:hypothetical protein